VVHSRDNEDVGANHKVKSVTIFLDDDGAVLVR